MKALKSIWNFLKGKKTYIGAALVIIGKGAELPIVEQIGTALAGLGVADKVKDEALGGRPEA